MRARFIAAGVFALAAFAQMRPAVVITPEQAMRVRINAFTPSDYRIALILEQAISDGRMNFADARSWLAAQNAVVADLAAKQAADSQP